MEFTAETQRTQSFGEEEKRGSMKFHVSPCSLCDLCASAVKNFYSANVIGAEV
jgi:hypothetical protein